MKRKTAVPKEPKTTSLWLPRRFALGLAPVFLALLVSASGAWALTIDFQAIHNGTIDDNTGMINGWWYDNLNNGTQINSPFPGPVSLTGAVDLSVGVPTSYGGQTLVRSEIWENSGGGWELSNSQPFPNTPENIDIGLTALGYQVRCYFTDPNFYFQSGMGSVSNQEVGTEYTVAWDVDSGAQNSTTLDLELSRDNGSTWTTINSSPIPYDYNPDGNLVWDGYYTYTVTGPVSSTCKLRLTASDIAGNEGSWTSNTFAITDGPAAPSLASPADGWYHPDPMPATTFTWNGNGGESSFNFQVATDAQFGNLVVNQSPTTASYVVTGLAADDYFWRVNATVAGETSGWSSTRSFSVVPINAAAPQGIAPLGGLIPDADGTTTVSFSWNDVDPSYLYALEVDDGTTFTAPLLHSQSELDSPSWSVELPNGSFVWRVRVLDSGHASEWSSGYAFALADNVPELVSPANGQSFQSPDEVALDWTGVAGAFMYQLQVSTAADFNAGALELETVALAPPFVVETSEFLSTGTRWWRVRAYVDGAFGPFSSASNFNYAYQFVPVQYVPGVNTLDISQGTGVSAILNNHVDPLTFTDQTYPVWGRQSGLIPATRQITGGRWLKVLPTNDFHPGETVTATLTTGLTSSVGGDALAEPVNYSFTVSADGFGEFHQADDLAQPSNSFDNCVADFNGDGLLDIASAERFDHSVSVILNQGNGVFGAYATYPAGPVGYEDYEVWSVAAADFDNDGDVDLVSTNYGHYSLSYYENDGTGSFATGVLIMRRPWPTGAPSDVAAEDIDGDGDMDLICGSTSAVLVFTNLGGAVFDENYVPYTVAGQAHNICTGDFNNDGFVDVATANSDTDNVTLLFNDGDGTYTVGATYAAPSYPLTIECADVNGDGYLDIAVAGYSFTATSTVRLLSNDGSGGFGASTDLSVNGGDMVSLAMFDADGDGDLDLLTGSNGTSSQVALLNNDGSGGFGAPSYMDLSGPSGDYYRPNGMATGDLNGDGTIDVALSHFSPSATSILYNLAAPGAVALYSPLDTKVIDHNAPNLDWLPVSAWGVEYTAQLDNDASFASPVLREFVGAADYWTVTPNLPEGTYYWRVQASNLAGTGPWSEVRSVIIDIPDPSCPVLFSYDGHGFVHENPLLTACEASGYRDVVTDHYLLPSSPVQIDGSLQFELRELEDEVTYLNDLELLTVDTPVGTEVTCTADGEVMVFRDQIAPIAAVDQDGNDVLELIVENDDQVLSVEGDGQITVTFPSLADGAIFSTNGGVKLECFPRDDYPQSWKTAGGSEGPSLTVEVLDNKGQWIDVADIPLRQFTRLESFSVGSLAGSSEAVQVRLSWTGRLETNVIAQFVPMDEAPAVESRAVSGSQHMVNHPDGIRRGSLGSAQPVELRRGDVLSFRFDVGEPVAEGMKRSFIIKARGRYEPDYAVHTGMIPTQHAIHGNFPNPFNPSTTFRFDLASEVPVTLTLFDVRGRLVRSLVSAETLGAGAHSVVWDGRDDAGMPISSGTYLYRFVAGSHHDSGRVMLVK